MTVLIYLILTPVIQVYHNFMAGYAGNHQWLDGLTEIKMYLFILLVIVFSRIGVKIKEKRKKLSPGKAISSAE
ncbi:hypothetical protein D3C73_1324210 [compost metagenome]